MRAQSIASWMIILVLTTLMLFYGQPVIIPFIIGLLIWFLIKKSRDLLDKIGWIKRIVPSWLKNVAATSLIFSLLFFVLKVLTFNISQLSQSYPSYLNNIEHIAVKINEVFNIDIREELLQFVSNYDFGIILESLFHSLSYMLGNMIMVVFYVVFLIIEESLFRNKFKLIFDEEKAYNRANQIFRSIEISMSRYIALKSMVNLCSATLSYVLLALVGIDSPLFWSFLIFLFGFIPSIGPIVATMLPTFFALIQFGEFTHALVIFFGVGTIVMLIGSLLEPRLMGNTLNISPLVAILSLAIWGLLWGVIGMLLSVPITVMLIIVLSQFDSTRGIAILLSEKGRIKQS